MIYRFHQKEEGKKKKNSESSTKQTRLIDTHIHVGRGWVRGDKMGVHIHIDAFTHALPLTRKSTQMLCGSFVSSFRHSSKTATAIISK